MMFVNKVFRGVVIVLYLLWSLRLIKKAFWLVGFRGFPSWHHSWNTRLDELVFLDLDYKDSVMRNGLKLANIIEKLHNHPAYNRVSYYHWVFDDLCADLVNAKTNKDIQDIHQKFIDAFMYTPCPWDIKFRRYMMEFAWYGIEAMAYGAFAKYMDG